MKAHHESACSQRDSWISRFIFQDVALAHPASLTNFNVFPVATGPWATEPERRFPVAANDLAENSDSESEREELRANGPRRIRRGVPSLRRTWAGMS